jgi:hypothetical protein
MIAGENTDVPYISPILISWILPSVQPKNTLNQEDLLPEKLASAIRQIGMHQLINSFDI